MDACNVIVDTASRREKDECCKCQTSLVGRNVFPAKNWMTSCNKDSTGRLWNWKFPIDVQSVYNPNNHHIMWNCANRTNQGQVVCAAGMGVVEANSRSTCLRS